MTTMETTTLWVIALLTAFKVMVPLSLTVVVEVELLLPPPQLPNPTTRAARITINNTLDRALPVTRVKSLPSAALLVNMAKHKSALKISASPRHQPKLPNSGSLGKAAACPIIERVVGPLLVTEAGLAEQLVDPSPEETVQVKLMVPVKLFTGLTVTVTFPVLPELRVKLAAETES